MQLNITARHLDLTPALSGYVHRKVEKAQRYFEDIIWAQAILSVEKRRHIAEIIVHTPGNTFRTKGEAGDLYSAIDLATHKLDLHLSRVKDKKATSPRRSLKAFKRSLASARLENPGSALFAADGGGSDKPIAVDKVPLTSIPLAQALKKLDSKRLQVLLFVNENTQKVSVLYRTGKKGYALQEAE